MSYVAGLGAAGMTLADRVKVKWTELSNLRLIDEEASDIAGIPSTTSEEAFRELLAKASTKSPASAAKLTAAFEQALREHRHEQHKANIPRPAASIPVVPLVVGAGLLFFFSRRK